MNEDLLVEELKVEDLIDDAEKDELILEPEDDSGFIHDFDAKLIAKTKVDTREYQERVIKRVIDAINSGHKTILINLPTGAGKTVIALKIAQILIETKGFSIGWTCMRRTLLQQARLENLSKFDIPISYFSTFAKEFPTGIDCLIEDEAQHSASNTSTKLHSKIEPKVHIAMTATPYRTDHMKLCFSKVVNDAGLRQLVDEGWLSPYHLYVFDGAWTPATVAAIYLENPEKWGKTIMFFKTKKDCYECQRILAERNIQSGVVIGGSLKTQEQELARFKAGKIKVLINVFVLTEGFNDEELKTVFIRPSAKGPTVQMGGRAFRKHVSKPYAQVVQCDQSPVIFSALASPEIQYIRKESQWHSTGARSIMVDVVMQNSLKAIATSEPPVIPKFIKRNKAPIRAVRRNNDQAQPPSPNP